jgi:hypothetical protein
MRNIKVQVMSTICTSSSAESWRCHHARFSSPCRHPGFHQTTRFALRLHVNPLEGTVVVPSRRPVMLLSDRSPRPLNYCLVLGIPSGVGVQRTGDASFALDTPPNISAALPTFVRLL